MNPRYLLLLLAIILYINPVHAQSWHEINPPPNIFNGSILTVAANSKGEVYAAGNFKNSNNEFIVAKWDGSSWAELKQGNNSLKASNTITCIAIDKNGNLYAAGGFTNNSGNYSVSKWDGSNWSEVGGSSGALKPNGLIYAMCVDDSNRVYVAGAITNSSGKQYVARWNGVNWSELGTGTNTLNANGLIYSLATKNGNVYAAGHFTNGNGKYYVAKWNGVNWSELGSTSPLNANDYINCIAADKAGNVYAAGAFKNSSGDYYLAKCDGTSWSETGGTNGIKANGPINSIAVNSSGFIYAGGFGTNISGNTTLMQWDGTSWSEAFNVGYGVNDEFHAICVDSVNQVWAGGGFKNNGGHTYVAKWDGHGLSEPGRWGDNLFAINGINCIAVTPRGEVYSTGRDINRAGYSYISHWDGKTWSEPGGDTASLEFNYLNVAMTSDLSGNVYVSGQFKNNNGKYYIAKWDGHAWSELGAGGTPIKIYSPINLMTNDKAGNIYAFGWFGDSSSFSSYILKWNGSSISFIPSLPLCSMFADGKGNIFAGVASQDNSGKYFVVKIDQSGGTTILGTGANALNSATAITAIAVDGKGNVLASGLNNAGYSPYNKFVAKWDGSKWSVAGSNAQYTDGYVESMIADDAGNVYAASATNGNGTFSVAKWDGNDWQQLGNIRSPVEMSLISTLAKDGRGNIYAAGLFSNTNGQQYVAYYGKNALFLEQPLLTPVASQYCAGGGNQTIKIINLPDSFFISAAAKIDNTQLSINADSTITINPSTLLTGSHQVKIVYRTSTDSMFVVKDFNITTAVTPDVNITASTTTVTNANPVVITAVNASGGGTNPKYTFAKDRTITTLLQAESASNTFNLDPSILYAGDNKIYVRMRTSDSCYTTQVNIDSIVITKSVATGVVDIDNPAQSIQVYPNPFVATTVVSGLQSNKTYLLILHNSNGQAFFRRRVHGLTSYEIKEHIPAGNNWLVIYDDSKNRIIGTISLVKL